MASVESERMGGRSLPARTATTPAPEEPLKRNDDADPYEGLVERLFALLEENQVAIATLAQAWRHTSRALKLTQSELTHTQERLAAERRIRRQA